MLIFTSVAYIGLPLVLHILDVKLSTSRSQCAMNQRRLQIYMEAMQMLRSQYDGTDRVSDYIEKLIKYLAQDAETRAPVGTVPMGMGSASDARSGVRLPATETASKPVGHVQNWSELFMRQPNCYLRIVMTLDLSFRKGQFPAESDFPTALQSSKLSKVLPLYWTTKTPATGDINESFHSSSENNRGVRHDPGSHGGTSMIRNATAPPPGSLDLSTVNHPVDFDEAQLQSESRSDYEQTYPIEIDLMETILGEGEKANFNLENWIYDVLPTFT